MSGPITASPTLYMGPLRGYTDSIYRNTFTAHFGGYDVAMAPFIPSTHSTKIRKKNLKDLLPENNSSLPVIPQILSRSAEGFTPLANCLFDLGYQTVNWNLGCPHPVVAKKQRGSGLLPHPDRIRSFLEESLPMLKPRLSIKTRLGWESKDDILSLIAIFNQYPLHEIIIHPRTGKQMYTGSPDLEAFEKCMSVAQHPIVYNGDIKTAADFKALSERFPAISRWMIGRGSLVDPFLPMGIKEGQKDIKDRNKKLKQFHDALFQEYSRVLNGPHHILNRMKAFWYYFAMSCSDRKSALKKIKKAVGLDEYMTAVNLFFDVRFRV
jgi:tRNA-dihydrouridine synthase B